MPKKTARKRTIVSDIFGQPIEQPINQKLKGNRNELTAAKFLHKWTGVDFVRTPSSGGRRLKNAKNFCGDVVCCDDDYYFPFTVETKHLGQITVTKTLRSNSEVFTIWRQAEADAVRASKEPMLLLRSNGMPAGTFHCFIRKVIADLLGIVPDYDGGLIVGFHSSKLLQVTFAKNLVDVIKSTKFATCLTS